MRFRHQLPGGSAAGTRAKPVTLDQHDRPESGLHTREGGGHAEHAAAHHQHVWTPVQIGWDTWVELSTLDFAELLRPQRLADRHVPTCVYVVASEWYARSTGMRRRRQRSGSEKWCPSSGSARTAPRMDSAHR